MINIERMEQQEGLIEVATYYDSNGKKIITEFDDDDTILRCGKEEWGKYWKPSDDCSSYDKKLTICSDKIELVSYALTKKINPYAIKEGFYCESTENGQVISIFDEKTKKTVITKVLNEDEFKEKCLRNKLARKRQFTEKALSNPWSHFATLTFSPEIAEEAAYSYSKAKKAFMSWRKSIVRKYGSKIKYMAIAEYGSSEAGTERIHWHVLLYFPDTSTKFEQAISEKGKPLYLMRKTEKGYRNVLDKNKKSIPKLKMPNWQYGVTDFYPIYNDKQHAINYMAKYMTKSEGAEPHEEEYGSKAYLSSHGLKKPKKEYLKQSEQSTLLSKKEQNTIEEAPATFQLKQYGMPVLNKKEATIDANGKIYGRNIKTHTMDIGKKHHQPKTPTPPTDDASTTTE